MRIFNADGSEAQMCGNGVRCIIGSKFVQLLKSEATPAKAVDKLLEALKQ